MSQIYQNSVLVAQTPHRAGFSPHEGGVSRHLGSNAKSKNKPVLNPLTGELTGGDLPVHPLQNRFDRFDLQAVAAGLLPNFRVKHCLILKRPDKDVSVLVSQESKTASFSGLQTCGSVWVCPVCAAKIAEKRRVELLHAMDMHKSIGGVCLLLTLTAPHRVSDDLADLLSSQAKALNSFYADRHVKALFKSIGYVGQVRALEVTHGRKSEKNNGWHPHYHILLFVGVDGLLVGFNDQQRAELACSFYLRWANACECAGLGRPSFKHGLRLDGADDAGRYVAKWGLENELTRGHTKKAVFGETPFDLLRAVYADRSDAKARVLFRNFAECFKGKRQLFWSKGLKKLFAILELTDDHLAAAKEEKAVEVGKIRHDAWCDVVAVKGRPVVLALAVTHGWEAVEYFLDSIKGRGVLPEKRQSKKATRKPIYLH